MGKKIILFILFLLPFLQTSLIYSQWVSRYNGPGNGTDEAFAVVIDAAGNVYITGSSMGSGSNLDYATVKYNSAGVQQWASRYNGPGNFIDISNSVAVDASGNVYVTGISTGTTSFTDYATVKYNSSGVEQWAARYNGPANGTDEAFSVVVDAAGNVYVTGQSLSGTNYDYATVKYNSAGQQQWASIEPGTAEIPNKFMLYSNFPNPFNPVTRIKFDIPAQTFTTIVVYDITGRTVNTLVNQNLEAGKYSYEI